MLVVFLVAAKKCIFSSNAAVFFQEQPRRGDTTTSNGAEEVFGKDRRWEGTVARPHLTGRRDHNNSRQRQPIPRSDFWSRRVLSHTRGYFKAPKSLCHSTLFLFFASSHLISSHYGVILSRSLPVVFSQIQGHMAGPLPPSPLRFACIHLDREKN